MAKAKHFNKFLTEAEQAHIEARNDAIELEREEEQARAEGYCLSLIHI